MNQGEISGAGVAAHIHQHVIPRWSGDVNFMPLIGQTKVLPKLLSQSREEIANAWQENQ
jgi:ATP adenylyltransferase